LRAPRAARVPRAGAAIDTAPQEGAAIDTARPSNGFWQFYVKWCRSRLQLIESIRDNSFPNEHIRDNAFQND